MHTFLFYIQDDSSSQFRRNKTAYGIHILHTSYIHTQTIRYNIIMHENKHKECEWTFPFSILLCIYYPTVHYIFILLLYINKIYGFSRLRKGSGEQPTWIFVYYISIYTCLARWWWCGAAATSTKMKLKVRFCIVEYLFGMQWLTLYSRACKPAAGAFFFSWHHPYSFVNTSIYITPHI